jgi:two-component system, sensor histidine kinase and response regulator
MRHLRGHHIWVLSRDMVVERDTGGQPVRAVGTHSDITARKELELHLQSALDQHQTLLEAAPLGVCQVAEGQIVQMNARMRAYLAEWTADTDPPALNALIPDRDLAVLEARARENPPPDGRPSTLNLDRAIPAVDGQLRWFRLHAQCISGRGLWHDGVVVLEDITERRRMTDELVRSRDAAQTSARLANGLLANVRHEFNTPLNAILGFTELMAMEATAPPMQGWARHVLDASRNLQRTLDNMQLLASLHAQSIDVHAAPLDVRALCENALLPHRDTAMRKHLGLTCDSSPLPPLLVTDGHWLGQALDRLLDNALKFTDHGRVVLSARVRDGGPNDELTLALEVSDSGPGVPGDQVNELFEVFRPGSPPGARASRGLGLGLATVRRIALAMGGQAYHRPGAAGGSVFGFTAQVRRCTEPNP